MRWEKEHKGCGSEAEEDTIILPPFLYVTAGERKKTVSPAPDPILK